MSPLLKQYLCAYNSLQAIGWAITLFRLLGSLSSTGSIHGAYASSANLICILQSFAFLEVIHGAIGIVPSGVLFPLMQWGGRTHFLLVVRKIDEVQELPSVFLTFFVWSTSEVIRYSHYTLSTLKSCPNWLTYIRYTAFIALYPLGVGPGEIWLMYKALTFVKKKALFADSFSNLPFTYYDFIRVLLLVYPFLWFKLYLHLFKQRRSKLGKNHDKKKR